MAPVRFETIAKSMGVSVSHVEELAKKEGFPSAGKGVAVLAEVVAFAQSLTRPESDITLQTKAVKEPDPVEIPAAAAQAEGVRWVTIRVPVLPSGAVLPGPNPVHSLRIRSSEHHIRDAWGKMLHGCREEKVRLRSGMPVVNNSESLKYLFELIADALSQE